MEQYNMTFTILVVIYIAYKKLEMLQLCALAIAYGRRKYVELQFEKIFFMLKPKNVPKSFNSTLTYIHFPSILTCT